MAFRSHTVAVSGFNDWADAQSNIKIVSASAIDANNLVVIYETLYSGPATVTTGGRVEDQFDAKGVGYNPPGAPANTDNVK